MRRKFNTTGFCNPEKHYMVNLDGILKRIKEKYVDKRSYFVINKGAGYGKTTTLRELAEYLQDDYIVIPLDFKQMGTEIFSDEATFADAFSEGVKNALLAAGAADEEAFLASLLQAESDKSYYGLYGLFECLSKMCAKASKPVVLMVDEADLVGNEQVFLDFLGQLRARHFDRYDKLAFHSVILAAVQDIINLDPKNEPGSPHRFGIPWNIAAQFEVDMDFSASQITSMLEEYEADYHTGMDIEAMAYEIYQYTSGYPVLVSSICKYIDEELPGQAGFEEPGSAWSREGVVATVRNMLENGTPLLSEMAEQVTLSGDLRDMIECILRGRYVSFCPSYKPINIGIKYGILRRLNGGTVIANQIIEGYLRNQFALSEVSV